MEKGGSSHFGITDVLDKKRGSPSLAYEGYWPLTVSFMGALKKDDLWSTSDWPVPYDQHKDGLKKEGPDGKNEQEVVEVKNGEIVAFDSQSWSEILLEMTRLKHLTLASSLMFVVTFALSPTGSHEPYSSINYYGKRPQPVYKHEPLPLR